MNKEEIKKMIHYYKNLITIAIGCYNEKEINSFCKKKIDELSSLITNKLDVE